MIKISQLPLITTPEQFFNTDKILFAGIFHIDHRCDLRLANAIRQHPNVFTHAGELYYPYFFVGSPENLFLNAKRGIPFSLNGELFAISWGGNLVEAIASKKVYDFSRYYKKHKAGKAPIEHEPEQLIERYILPKSIQPTT